MGKKLIRCCLIFGLFGIVAWVSSASAVLNIGGFPNIYNNSPLHCADLITGGTNQNINDAHYVCTIQPSEIAYACVNHGGNADTAQSHIFLPQTTTLTKTELGSTFTIQKNGKTTADIEFTDADIKNALADIGIVLDPAVLCPNKNFSLSFVITSATVFVDLLTGPSTNSCIPASAVDCNPATNTPAGCTENACFYLDPCTKPDPNSFLQQSYNCTCRQHFSNSGGFTTAC